MKNMIKKIPLPICGVILGLAAFGNLLQTYSEGIRYVCGIIAGAFLLLVFAKMILFPQAIKEDMENPIMASVSGTFPMSLMILSTYVKPFIGQWSYYLWLLSIGLHITLIVYFTWKFILKLHMSNVFASYYIVYVGIVVAAITAPVYEHLGIGVLAFWFGFVSLIVLFILITARYIKFKTIPEPAKPLICIYAAPVSLCVVGYIQSVTPKSYGFLIGMYIVATGLYIFALIRAVGYFKMPFYPSRASFTFPFVISAMASKQMMVCLGNMGHPVPIFSYIVLIQIVIAVVFVANTLIKFVQFIVKK